MKTHVCETPLRGILIAPKNAPKMPPKIRKTMMCYEKVKNKNPRYNADFIIIMKRFETIQLKSDTSAPMGTRSIFDVVLNHSTLEA